MLLALTDLHEASRRQTPVWNAARDLETMRRLRGTYAAAQGESLSLVDTWLQEMGSASRDPNRDPPQPLPDWADVMDDAGTGATGPSARRPPQPCLISTTSHPSANEERRAGVARAGLDAGRRRGRLIGGSDFALLNYASRSLYGQSRSRLLVGARISVRLATAHAERDRQRPRRPLQPDRVLGRRAAATKWRCARGGGRLEPGRIRRGHVPRCPSPCRCEARRQ